MKVARSISTTRGNGGTSGIGEQIYFMAHDDAEPVERSSPDRGQSPVLESRCGRDQHRLHRRAEAATPGRGETGTQGPYYEGQNDELHRSMRREGLVLHGGAMAT